jgi:hypothetical protein
MAMRFATLAIVAVLVLAASAFALSPTNIAPVKDVPPVTPPPVKSPDQGGDTIATAVLIGSLPYDDTGTTVGYTHDYDEVCTYTGSLSPDVVYKFSPAANVQVDIYTCNSGYDTKIYVYDNTYTPGAPLACNDDSNLCTGPAYRSYIQALQLYAGHTYYIVVDGYGSASGAYEFHVREYLPPPPCYPDQCPAWASQEGEPICYDGYVDNFNGGCNSTPNIFSNVVAPFTVCGTSGVYDNLTKRDTDWYMFTLTTTKTMKVSVCAQFPVLTGFINLSTGCPVTSFHVSASGAANTWITATGTLTPGTWVAWVGPSSWAALNCGAKYIVAVYEEGTVPVENTTWGTVKALYR